MGANAESQNEGIRYFKLIAKAEKADPMGKKAIVEIAKEGEEYVQRGWYSSLSGFITHGEIREFEYEGKMKKKCILIIKDGHETCQLEFTFNFASYGLINAMLCTDFSMEVEISAWISKGYVGAGIRYAGSAENIQWGIPLAEQPKGLEYKTPGGEEAKDYTNVTNFWIEKFKLICPKLKRENMLLAAHTPVARIEQGASTSNDAELSASYDPISNPYGTFKLESGELITEQDERHPNYSGLPF
jgi:hypothetical protein